MKHLEIRHINDENMWFKLSKQVSEKVWFDKIIIQMSNQILERVWMRSCLLLEDQCRIQNKKNLA